MLYDIHKQKEELLSIVTPSFSVERQTGLEPATLSLGS